MVLAGEKVRASDIRTVRVISKAGTESVTSSTTLQDDDDLVVALEAGKSYRVTLILTVSSGGAEAADIKVAWSFTGTATKAVRSLFGPETAMTDATATLMRWSATALTSSVTYGIDAGAATAIVEDVVLEDLTVAGTLQLQWAQNSSSGTATTLSNSSRIIVEQVDVG